MSRVGWEPFNVVNNAFPGVPKKKIEAPREPVKNFNFQIDPKHLDLDLYHQNQLNWLNDNALALVMHEEQTRDFVDQSCGDLKGSIDELEKWLKKIDQEGVNKICFQISQNKQKKFILRKRMEIEI